jgi:hypothetical protein
VTTTSLLSVACGQRSESTSVAANLRPITTYNAAYGVPFIKSRGLQVRPAHLVVAYACPVQEADLHLQLSLDYANNKRHIIKPILMHEVLLTGAGWPS